ncbi:MAG TPA: zf-HC2 domain-containing protein [Bryobacteraceae bacterium]|nr:zf-HC2 domain-containing protein [Bryobacteraceae bacterium]
MNCAEIEILICEYVDGTLTPAQRAEVESHLGVCANCAALERDAAAAVAFMEKAAEVEPPPELITRMLFHAPWQKSKTGWIPKIFNSVLQPKFALSMAMTILSFSMLFGQFRQLRPADLEPAKVWADIEDRAYRTWARTMKFYDNLKFVYQIQTTLREWQQDQEAQQPASESETPRNQTDEYKLPVRTPGAGSAPAPNPTGGPQ